MSVDSPSNSCSWNYDSAGNAEGTSDYSGVPDHDQSTPSYGDGAARAEVGSRSSDTMSSAMVVDGAPDVAKHHGLVGALINVFEVVVNVLPFTGGSPTKENPAPAPSGSKLPTYDGETPKGNFPNTPPPKPPGKHEGPW